MKKNFGRVSRNESEDIRISLTEVQEELFVELPVYSRSARHGGGSQPEPEGIVVPVHALSELCHLLEQTHNHILKEGLVNVPTLGNLIVSEDGAATPSTWKTHPPPSPMSTAGLVCQPDCRSSVIHWVLRTLDLPTGDRQHRRSEQRERTDPASQIICRREPARRPHEYEGTDLSRTGRGCGSCAASTERILPT